MPDPADADTKARQRAARLRLAEIAESRRAEIKLSTNKVFPSHETWRSLMRGESKRPPTYRELEDSLGWMRGSVADVLAGGEPRVEEEAPPGSAPPWVVLGYITDVGRRIDGAPGMTPEEHAKVLGALEAGRERLREAGVLPPESARPEAGGRG